MLFYFNQHSSLLLPAFIQGVLFSVLFLFRGFRQGRLSDKLLAALLLIYTLRVSNWMLGYANWYDAHDWHTTFMFYLPFSHWLAAGPLVYFYFLSLTNRDFKFQKKHWWHFLPEGLWLLRWLVVFVVDVAVNHWMSGEPLPEFFNTQGRLSGQGLGWLDETWDYLEYLSIFTYLLLTLRLYRSYRRYLLDHFSDTENIDFSWLRNFLIANLIGHLVWMGFDVYDLLADEYLTYAQDWYSFFFLGILIYYLSIAGYHSGNRERQLSALHFQPEKAAEPPSPRNLEDGDLETLKPKLLSLLASEKPFLDPDLNLGELAARMKISPSMLSRVINAGFGKNFNEFINEYRIEAVKSKLLDPENSHLSLLGVAFECGFNSKATFNRAFKKQAGMSPSEYAKKK